MRADQLVSLLHRLRLKPASQRAAKALGVSLRQLQRMTAGHVPVPKPVALLAIAYTKLGGVPDPLWNVDVDKVDAIASTTKRLLASNIGGAPLPRARKIEAAPEPITAPATAPEPEPPRSPTRRRQPAPLTSAQIKWRADRAQARAEGKPIEAPYPEEKPLPR
jgi:hypothetical protein